MFGRQGTPKTLQVLAHEESCLKMRPFHIEHIIIPIEQCPALLLEHVHQFLLHIIEHIKACKNYMRGQRCQHCLQRIGTVQPFYHLAKQGTLIQFACGHQGLLEPRVDGQ